MSQHLNDTQTIISLLMRITALENALVKKGVISSDDLANEMAPIYAKCQEIIKKKENKKE